MTNNTAKNKIIKTMEKHGVRINKISMSGITNTENEFKVKKTILSLDAPQDNDIANVLNARQDLEEQDIILVNILLEL